MTSQRENKLLLNFISLGAVQGFSSLIQLIVIPFVIAKTGVEGYGIIAVAQVVMFFLTVIVDYSFNQTSTRTIALRKSDPLAVSAVFSATIVTRLILCSFTFLILLALVGVIPYFQAHAKVYIYGFLFVAGQSLMIPWFFQGLEKMHYIAFSVLLSRVLFAVLVFIFINDRDDLPFFLFFLGAGSLIAGILSLFLAFRIYPLKWKATSVRAVKNELMGGWPVALSHISNWVCHYSGVLILRIFATDLLVGYYSVAERIYFTIKQVFLAFSQAIYPRICLLVEKGNEVVFGFLKKTYLVFLLITIFCGSLLFLFADKVLYFFMGDEYIHSIFYLRVFCIVAIVVCLNIPGTVLLLARNRQFSYFRTYMIASIINIIGHFFLAGFFLADGTVTAIFITEFFITMSLTRSIYREGQKTTEHAEGLPVETSY
jgi:polysaccharide transporter, PST family